MQRDRGAGYEPMNTADTWWAMTTREAQQDLESDPTYHVAMRAIGMLDIMPGTHATPGGRECGFGQAMAGVQDTGGAMLGKQLISSDITDTVTHMQEAVQLKHPASGKGGGDQLYGSPFKAKVQQELTAAIEYAVRHPSMAGEFDARGEEVRRIADMLKPLSAKMRAKYSPQHIRCTAFEPMNMAFASACTMQLGLADRDLPMRMLLGTKVAGDLPPMRAWDPRYRPRTLGLDFEDLPHGDFNAWLHGDIARKATNGEQGATDAETVRAKTVSEIDKGLADGFFDKEDLDARWGYHGWRACRRFSVMQGEPPAPRVCDNAKENLINAGSSNRDQLRLVAPDFPARMARGFADAIRGAQGSAAARKPGSWSLVHGTEDVGAAYRKATTRTQRWTVIAMYNTRATPRPGEEPNEDGYCPRVQYVLMPGFPFGLISSVSAWCSIATFAAHVARRMLAVTTEGYIDDFDIVGLEEWDNAPQMALRKCMDAIGVPFSEEKHEPMAPIRVFCGVVTDFTRVRKEGVVMVYVSQKRRKKVSAMLNRAKSGLSPAQARSLVGKLGFTLSWAFGRVGRAGLQPLQRRADSESDDSFIDRPLLRSLEFLRQIVDNLPRREIRLEADYRMPVVVWSDARYESDAGDPAQGGFVVYVPPEGEEAERWIACSHITPPEVVAIWDPRHQYIGQLELYYAVAPYWTLPEVFKDRQVLHFIDNTSACAGLIKGYARALDSGLIVNAFHAFNAGLKADVYFEYIRSKANVADYPSRDAWEELWKTFEAIGVDNAMVEWVECELPPVHSLQSPTRAWMNAAVRMAEAGEATAHREPDTAGAGRAAGETLAERRAEEESGAAVETPGSRQYYVRRWVRDARFHEYDEYVGSPHERTPDGVCKDTVMRRARRYGMPPKPRDGSRGERARIVREHKWEVLSDPRKVERVRSELRGRRLASVNGGWPCMVNNLAEIANCGEDHLKWMMGRIGL